MGMWRDKAADFLSGVPQGEDSEEATAGREKESAA